LQSSYNEAVPSSARCWKTHLGASGLKSGRAASFIQAPTGTGFQCNGTLPGSERLYFFRTVTSSRKASIMFCEGAAISTYQLRYVFFTNIVSVTVFTACLCLLAWNNRKGDRDEVVCRRHGRRLVKLVLQGLEGNISPVLGDMVTNELYLISFVMQLLGLRWFVLRKPIRQWWAFIAIGLALVTIPSCFSTRSRTSAMSSTFPIFWCAA